MSVGGIGSQSGQAVYETRKKVCNAGIDFDRNVKNTALRTENKVDIDADALFSICHVQTGESANIYRSADYSEDNPVYIVKGIDENGNKYEQTVDVRKTDPNNCSYTEMLVLNVHLGNRSDKDLLSMAVLKDKAQNFSYTDKADYLAAVCGLRDDMKTAGSWDGYLRYNKWINGILDFLRSRQEI